MTNSDPFTAEGAEPSIESGVNQAENRKGIMKRDEFLNKSGRYLLLIFMAIIVFALGKKVVSASNCSSCPGNGICKGESDCSNFKVAGR